MSEYQYYEFCKIDKPLSAEARKEMHSLSSRAKVGTHGASYEYNYGDFKGKPKALLLKYFDVFFYISNWGTVQLMFRYPAGTVDFLMLKKHQIKHIIECEQVNDQIVLDITLNNEDGFGWTEGEEVLSDLLPLYDAVKTDATRFLELVTAIHDELSGETEGSFKTTMKKLAPLSAAEKALIKNIGMEN